MFKDAKVGDRVWDIQKGWGSVIKVDYLPQFPIQVCFTNRVRSYTYDGKWEDIDTGQTLFWDEVKITPPPKPKKKVSKQWSVTDYSISPQWIGYMNGKILECPPHYWHINFNVSGDMKPKKIVIEYETEE